MGSFFGQNEKPAFTPEVLSVLGIEGGFGKDANQATLPGKPRKPGPPSPPPTGGDDERIAACKKTCDENYNECMDAAEGDYGQEKICVKAKQNCYNMCVQGGGDFPSCPAGEKLYSICRVSGGLATNACPTIDKKCFRNPPPTCTVHSGVQTCPPGEVWDTTLKKCVKSGGDCEGITIGPDWTGCPCGKYYTLPAEQAACKSGYVPLQKPEGTRCECQKWCVDIGYGETCEKEDNQLGEWNFPPEMLELYQMLMGRAKEYLERRPGLSGGALELMEGGAADRLRGGEAASRLAQKAQLSAQGLTGTGAGQAMLRQPAMETERNIGNLIRDLALTNEQQTRTDREQYTNIANQLFGTGMGYNTTIEALNAGRRGEARDALAQFIEWLRILMGGYTG